MKVVFLNVAPVAPELLDDVGLSPMDGVRRWWTWTEFNQTTNVLECADGVDPPVAEGGGATIVPGSDSL